MNDPTVGCGLEHHPAQFCRECWKATAQRTLRERDEAIVKGAEVLRLAWILQSRLRGYAGRLPLDGEDLELYYRIFPGHRE